ncbi:helix-turn-helix domain-containing protein [Virgibacillus xinjiangensis]|uniref:Helix-turn-helix domain-containing protein n=1 Tax=Virgibacillus xinjiangensis TaxID=393090 RepID=A0ABV7CRS4_9BACI
MILEGLILHSISQIREERTISSIYHLLSGKKSIQTVQDAHIYSLEPLFGVYKRLDKRFFYEVLEYLLSLRYIQVSSKRESAYLLTKEGESWLHNSRSSLGLEKLNGLKYHETGQVFLERLTLFIQTLTNTRNGHFSFIPVVDKPSIEAWVKSFYQRTRNREIEMLEEMYKELYQLLHRLTDEEAGIFTDRLSGYKRYGMSLDQLANKYSLCTVDVHLRLTTVTHHLMDLVLREPHEFPVLHLFLRDLKGEHVLSNSAAVTYRLLKNGLDISQIAVKRNLKENTIHDHIVEIALHHQDFCIDIYFNTGEKEEITQAIRKAGSHRLKDIKQLVNDEISYFKIRLLIAREKTIRNEA